MVGCLSLLSTIAYLHAAHRYSQQWEQRNQERQNIDGDSDIHGKIHDVADDTRNEEYLRIKQEGNLVDGEDCAHH